jgi:hypothetical protein
MNTNGKSESYIAGVNARIAGKLANTNPHKDAGVERDEWNAGYYDMHSEAHIAAGEPENFKVVTLTVPKTTDTKPIDSH